MLNVIFGDCLVKYIDVLGRKGCCRTAVEYCKLLLGLNPHWDFHGVLMRIDYYAIRAREYNYLLYFIENFSDQFYGVNKDAKIPCIKLLPNLMMASALAIKRIGKEEEVKNHNENIAIACQNL